MTATKTKRAASLKVQHDHQLASPRTGNVRRARTIARVVAQFAHEDAGRYCSLNEPTAYALALTDAAHAARKAVASGTNPRPHYPAARSVTKKCAAELVTRGDLDGMVLGVKFSSGRFTSGAENIFYVA